MATFSENQVRHLFVVNSADNFTAAKSGEALYFTMTDVDGKPVRSDLIENILQAKAVDAASMARKTKVVKVTMDSDALSSNAPIAGEDYTLRIEYRQFIAQSDEVFYHEFASAHAKSTSTVSSLLLDLAKNLAKNTKRQGMVKVTLDTATTGEVEIANYVASTNGAVQGIFIKEIEQPWILGVKQETPVLFTVTTGTVVVNGDEMAWGVVADTDLDSKSAHVATTLPNGKTIADMEYFYHGERGDIYRNVGWPQVIPTRYMVQAVDPSTGATKAYDVIDIHYAYIGANHSVQKSEKTITIVCPQGGTGHVHDVVNAVIGKINAQKANLLSTLS